MLRLMESRSTVALIHGLARTARCFGRLRQGLGEAGYQTWACSYPSMRYSMARAARYVVARMQAELGEVPSVIITHSAGGIVTRYIGAEHRLERVLMFAPPNQGSRLARAVGARSRGVLRVFAGPAGRELAAPEHWPEPRFHLGVVAGTRPSLAEGPQTALGRRLGVFTDACVHDGTIHIEDTRHDAERSRAEVAAGHTFLTDHPDSLALTLRFLAEGSLA